MAKKRTGVGQRHRERMAARSRAQQAAAAEVGPIPRPKHPRIRKSCQTDLERFLVHYFPESTGLYPFSEDHRRAIRRIQRCCLEGGRFVNAFPRGFGKTSIAQNAALWAVLYGHRAFAAVFAANARGAHEIVESIKLECEQNERLAEDFPEVCLPVRALERKTQRCKSQTQAGRPTYIEWTASRIVLPTIVRGRWRTPSSGAVLSVHGLTSGVRGLVHKRPDGRQQRPDLVLIDDPQDQESAESPLQCEKRLRLISRSILRLGGHESQLAAVVNATVIARDDVIDQLLDPKRFPAWQGERIPMVRQWAKSHETLWLEQYAGLRNGYDPSNPDDQRRAHREARKFYKAHRKEMDAGAKVSWEHCYDHETELSAIQHAYNLLIDDGAEAFAAECQNQPQELLVTEGALEVKEISKKLNKRKRGIVPQACEHLTALVDVHDRLLYWAAAAWEMNFSGAVVDYGSHPEQSRAVFAMRDVRKTLARKYPRKGIDGAIVAGLVELIGELLGRQFEREDGQQMQIGLLLVDSGYKPDVVHEAIRLSGQLARARPSLGRPVGASHRPIAEYTYKPGDRRGHFLGLFRRQGRILPIVEFDANYYKSLLRNGLAAGIGESGGINLYGGDPGVHRLLAEHCTAEYPVVTQGQGRKLEEWKLRPNRENHWWDCLVGSAVAASILGCKLAADVQQIPKAKRRRKRVSYLH